MSLPIEYERRKQIIERFVELLDDEHPYMGLGWPEVIDRLRRFHYADWDSNSQYRDMLNDLTSDLIKIILEDEVCS
jgi:hypothetical protein